MACIFVNNEIMCKSRICNVICRRLLKVNPSSSSSSSTHSKRNDMIGYDMTRTNMEPKSHLTTILKLFLNFLTTSFSSSMEIDSEHNSMHTHRREKNELWVMNDDTIRIDKELSRKENHLQENMKWYDQHITFRSLLPSQQPPTLISLPSGNVWAHDTSQVTNMHQQQKYGSIHKLLR